MLQHNTNPSVRGQEVMPWWRSHVLVSYLVLKWAYVIWESREEANHYFLFQNKHSRCRRVYTVPVNKAKIETEQSKILWTKQDWNWTKQDLQKYLGTKSWNQWPLKKVNQDAFSFWVNDMFARENPVWHLCTDASTKKTVIKVFRWLTIKCVYTRIWKVTI